MSGIPPRLLGKTPALGFSWLDIKLGIRMLAKQPVLTTVAGLTLALGIPASLAPTHVMGIFDATFPVEEGDRIVGIRNWNVETTRPDIRAIHDLAVWKDDLRSFQTVGAARSDPWNVHSPDGRAGEVRGAEVTASVFDMLRVPPRMGRTLLASDEVAGAPDVVVISSEIWGSRFASDPDIVGRVIGIGRTPHTVVGVMPEGFYFPMMDHLWLPLRANPNDYPVGGGPDLFVFGRLADGVSAEQAEVELITVGSRLAADWPETHRAFRPEVVRIPVMAFGMRASGLAGDWEFILVQIFAFTLLAIACGNVGILILARTATRTSEISVRSALGASRGRILSQLFIESFVLAIGATGMGLLFVHLVVLGIAESFLGPQEPYWFDLSLGPRSIFFALGLAATCAVLAGVLPAIRATSPKVQQNLQRNAAGTTVRFGPFTTLLVVAEVALSVGFLSFGTAAMVSFMRDRSGEADIRIERYLTAALRTPWVDPVEGEAEAYENEFWVRVAENHEGLRDQLQADGSVRRVAMGRQLPGFGLPDRNIVFQGSEESDGARVMVGTAYVHIDYFRDMEMEMLSGRGFSTADVSGERGAHRPAVIVNQEFADRFFGGGEAVGRTLRYAVREGEEPRPWHEIVGVVETFGTNIQNPDRRQALYHPLGSSDQHPMRYIIELGDNPADFIPSLRRIASSVDPDAMVQSPATLTEIVEQEQLANRLASLFVFGLSAMGMVLAATGLYAVMSFTVSQRRREIGIRTALGAGASNVVATIARRAFLQLIVGIVLGSGLGWWIVQDLADQSEFAVDSVFALVGSVAGVVLLFAVLSCLSPTLRGLRIQPTEALRQA